MLNRLGYITQHTLVHMKVRSEGRPGLERLLQPLAKARMDAGQLVQATAPAREWQTEDRLYQAGPQHLLVQTRSRLGMENSPARHPLVCTRTKVESRPGQAGLKHLFTYVLAGSGGRVGL